MANIKKRMLSLGTALLILIAMLSITVHAATYSVTFKWDRLVLDGSANNKYYNLNKGTAKLDTTCKITGGKNASNFTKITYTVELYRSIDWWVDKGFGTINQDAFKTDTKNGAIWTADKKAKYYLIFTKDSDYDYVEVTGSGTLTN